MYKIKKTRSTQNFKRQLYVLYACRFLSFSLSLSLSLSQGQREIEEREHMMHGKENICALLIKFFDETISIMTEL